MLVSSSDIPRPMPVVDFTLTTHGCFCDDRVGDTANGQRFGNLALRLTEMYQVEAWMGRVATFYFSSVQTWTRPFRESLPPMRAARQIALLSGDIEFAMVNANLTCVLELDLV